MHTNTLTIPTFLPGASPSPRSANSEPRGLLQQLRLPRELRLPRDLRLVAALRAKMPARDPVLQLEKRLQKSAQRGRRVILGTAELPYDPLILGGAPLAALEQFEGLDIVLSTSSPEIREKLDLLIELDRRHAITVDMLVATCDPRSPDLRERLSAVSALAAEGLTTRLVATDLPEARGGELPRRAAAQLRLLFEEARDCRAFDVAATEGGPEWGLLIQRLRLEHGFPCRLPGRG